MVNKQLSVQERYPRLLDVLRYTCAYLLYVYGISKLAHLQFDVQSQISQRPIGSLTGFDLTWYYYGYSRTYACILGLVQLMGATALLFRKSALLGAALVTPMIANILLINIFYLRINGPLYTSSLILASMLLILWSQRAAMLRLFWTGQPTEASRVHNALRAAIILGAILSILGGVFAKNYFERTYKNDKGAASGTLHH